MRAIVRAMKRTKQCPKCQSLRIGYLPDQPDADDSVHHIPPHGGDPRLRSFPSLEENLPARAVGRSKESVETGWLQHGTVIPLLGRLEAYVCTDCGYHETYVTSPAALPWEKLVGFAWVNVPGDPDGPYR